MQEQTKTALEHGNGMRIPCGVCGGRGTTKRRPWSPPVQTCERCHGKGSILYPVRYFADRLTA